MLIYDMHQNFAGWARLRIKAAAGTAVRMRFSEAVDAKTGALDTASTGVFATGVEQIDTYICRGGGEETWEPRFTYHGFRYVEVTGLPARSQPPKLEGIVVHTDVEPAGGFICSDPMLNRIHQAAVWTLVSNLHGHPTDCPARERCGWLGDAHGSAEMAAMNFDMSGFWTKYIDDIEAGWVSDLPPAVVPGKRIARDSGPIDWGVAVVMLPWFHWLYYGDRTELERCYPLMTRFVNAAAKTAKDGILSNGLGDWCPPGSVQPTATPVPLTTTAWFVEAARITAKTWPHCWACCKVNNADVQRSGGKIAERLEGDLLQLCRTFVRDPNGRCDVAGIRSWSAGRIVRRSAIASHAMSSATEGTTLPAYSEAGGCSTHWRRAVTAMWP